ncbi:leucyl aminopeptidase [Arcanobacterium wilhelmae]|uniref:Probable cytosol aminopeptidase n=1 Tax=Arcanobacterium wilhelmae TaxID=1803177 RepID=A0ABT9N909_9ACTO|nr:leucyl aminopeptidase [Arcanobacterium wilhelmae]MDP9800185.1 leucyl aminopeptidase [Arcanobacterium wilhelmae]WFN89626.1 leucyl aminopeptidase [Arcanobacterium wilhelmae]
MTTLTVSNILSAPTAPTIVGLVGDPLTVASNLSDATTIEALAAAFTLVGASTSLGSTTTLVHNGAVVIGVGLGDDAGHEELRQAAGAGVRAAAGLGEAHVALAHEAAIDLEAIVEGSLFAAYDFTTYHTPKKPAVETITVHSPITEDVDVIVEHATVLRDSIARVRDLVNTAPNHLNPENFSLLAKDEAEKVGLSVKIYEGQELVDEKLNGLIAVGKGAEHGPRLVRVEWNPEGAKGYTALVGKGITYDSGGYSLKPSTSMVTMKTDMTGSATILQTVIAAARLGIQRRVVAWMCLAENMVSATSSRPDDVITYRNGTTVEINNTDAEGRVVMADGLIMATEEKPDEVIDIATLTGAQIIALGNRYCGVMGTESIRDDVVAAADMVGELAWPMPLPKELRKSLDSPVADMRNSGSRPGGMLVAGLYLKEFVGDTPWAHIDIAGPSFNQDSAWGYTPKNATGVMVRTLVGFLEEKASE